MATTKQGFLALTALTGLFLTCFILIGRWPKSKESYKTSVENKEDAIREVTAGETIQPYPLQIHISTAIYYADFPAHNGYNVFLNGWMRHGETDHFKCCFLQEQPDKTLDMDILTEVKAWLYQETTKWIVDMQAAEFSCSISRDQLAGIGLDNFTHVTFVRETCLEAPRLVLPILFPRRVPKSVGVCLKVTYGSLDATCVLEWMEYQRMMAVTSVFTYTFDLDPPAQAVLDYYVKLGFVTAIPAHPQPSKDGPARGFRRPRYENQSFVDEVWAANDCKHRMSGLDFVIVMDIDEFIVPQNGLKTYHDILEVAQREHPQAAGFSFNSHVMLLDWGATRESPLQIGRYTLRTRTPNYDGEHQNSRWASIPHKTYYLLNNLVVPRKPFEQARVPQKTYTLLHYRRCKANWKGCAVRRRVEDKSMLQHELPLVERILALPNLDSVLYNNTDYLPGLRKWLNKEHRNRV